MTTAVETAPLHPTTEACLQALQWLHERRRPGNVLDMGCGSGILSLAAAKLWDAPVLAADISPQAVADTQRHCNVHRMESRLTIIRSDGFSHTLIGERAPYDLIIFNLLAEPITQMAPQVKSQLAPGGACILSGILEWLAPEVERAYHALGFAFMHTMTHSPWRTYIMQRAP